MATRPAKPGIGKRAKKQQADQRKRRQAQASKRSKAELERIRRKKR